MADSSKWGGSVSGIVDAPLDKVWNITSKFGGLMKWTPPGLLDSCEIVAGEEGVPGCTRLVIFSARKSKIRETLIEFSGEEHLLKYKIEGHPVLEGVISTQKFSKYAKDENKTVAEWSYQAPFDQSNPDKEKIISDIILGFYQAGVESLNKVVMA